MKMSESVHDFVLKNKAVSRSSRILVDTRLRYARNFSEYPFPSAIDKAHAESVWCVVSDALGSFDVFKNGYKFYLPDLGRTERILLIERRAISPDMLKSRIPSGAILSGDERMSALINEEDHLRLSVFGSDVLSEEGLCASIEELNSVEARLSGSFDFAYRKKYGYLTSCPTNLGSGLRISGLFHLAGLVLTKKINKFLETLESRGVVIRGYYGEKSRFLGDVFQISSGASVDEKESSSRMSVLFRKIESEELKAREELSAPKNKTRCEDIIYRSFGILENARIISFAEAVSVFSLVLLGKHLGLDIPLDEENIHRMMRNTQPAHIQMFAGKELNSKMRDEFRAEYIRKSLGARDDSTRA